MRLRLLIAAASVALTQESNTEGEQMKVRHRLPVMSSVFPQGSTPGERLRIEVLGEYLDRAGTALFLDSDISARVLASAPTRLELELEVNAAARWGPHYFRVVSPRGASNILLFRIGDQPHALEREPNSTRQTAQIVQPPVTVNGRLNTDGDFDFFRFRAEKGQSWIFDLRAARNGNGLDGALILLDAEGRKLAHSEERFIWDPFFEHTFEQSGDYTIVVQPTHGRLDPNFAYQLDVRAAPYLETLSPLSARPGSAFEAVLFGVGLHEGGQVRFDAPGFEGQFLEARGSNARLRIRVPENARAGPHEVWIETQRGRSNPATLLVDPTPVHASGDVIAPPVAIHGVARYRQPERFTFDAKAGQSLVFEVHAHRYGSPVDSILRLLDAAGKVVATNDDVQLTGVEFNKDSRLAHTFKQDGRYTIEMRNLWAVTGENFPYQLRVAPPEPAFDLMLASDQPYVYPGQSGSIKLNASRRDGFDGAVDVRAACSAPGIELEAGQIPASKNDAEIAVRAGDLKPGTFCMVEAASASGVRAWRSVRIASGGGEGAAFAKVDRATLVVAQKPMFSLEAGLSTVNLVRGGTAEIPVAIRRESDYDALLTFSAENLPAGVLLEPLETPAAAGSIKLRFRASESAPPGRSPRVAILATAPDGRMEEAPRITVVVD